MLWAGTDDGLVHVSRDRGETWREITPPDLPEWALISIIDVSAHQAGAAYVAATRYKLDDNKPYLYKTTDYGESWTAITNGIPEHEFTRVIREDPNRRGLLYAGTETGIYITFDDGEKWQRMRGNLPVCPIHDLVIKDSDLVVATHGRSFWILDDLSPLHQAQGELDEGNALLFAPAPKVRMRVYYTFGGWESSYPPDTVDFGRIDTSVVAFVNRADSDRPQLLNAGANPREGIVFWYHLPGETEGAITLNFRSADGELIRSYSSGKEGNLSAAAGLNRFEWNMRYPGTTGVDGVDGWWERPDGPLVLPGEYVAELVVAGESCIQRFEVRADPRVEATTEEFKQQFKMLLAIRDRLSQNNELINKLVRLKRQVKAWAARSDDEALQAAAKEIAAEVEGRLPELINVGFTESQLYASGLHEKFNALFESVDSADYAPPQQAREVFAQLSDELDGQLNYARTDLGETVSDFNARVRELGLEAVDLL